MSEGILDKKCPNCKEIFQTYDIEKLFCGCKCKQEYVHSQKLMRKSRLFFGVELGLTPSSSTPCKGEIKNVQFK